MSTLITLKFLKVRGVASNVGSRFNAQQREGFDDSWDLDNEFDAERKLVTAVTVQDAEASLATTARR